VIRAAGKRVQARSSPTGRHGSPSPAVRRRPPRFRSRRAGRQAARRSCRRTGCPSTAGTVAPRVRARQRPRSGGALFPAVDERPARSPRNLRRGESRRCSPNDLRRHVATGGRRLARPHRSCDGPRGHENGRAGLRSAAARGPPAAARSRHRGRLHSRCILYATWQKGVWLKPLSVVSVRISTRGVCALPIRISPTWRLIGSATSKNPRRLAVQPRV